MKKTIAVTIALLTFNTFAGLITPEERNIILEKAARKIRHGYWERGFKDVTSENQFMTLDQLVEYTSDEQNGEYEESLTKAQIAELFLCFHNQAFQLGLIQVDLKGITMPMRP